MANPHQSHDVSSPSSNEFVDLPAIGEYHVLSLGPDHSVAVSTLRNADMAEEIAKRRPRGLSIVGKTDTENIGIEKIIKNVLAVPTIRYLILCGKESGHFSGNTLLSIAKNGVDDKMKVIGAKSKKPILVNTTMIEVNSFRSQVNIIDMIDCEDMDKILHKLDECYREAKNSAYFLPEHRKPVTADTKVIEPLGKDPKAVKLDKAGYFVIVPKHDSKMILVEHYSNTNELLRVIKGANARDIYWTILENKWVTELSHAAYLGKELTLAEMSMRQGVKYVQDMA